MKKLILLTGLLFITLSSYCVTIRKDAKVVNSNDTVLITYSGGVWTIESDTFFIGKFDTLYVNGIAYTTLGILDTTGLPVANQLAVFTSNDHIKGEDSLLWQDGGLELTGRLKSSTERFKFYSSYNSNNELNVSTITNDTGLIIYDDIVGDGSVMVKQYELLDDGINAESEWFINYSSNTRLQLNGTYSYLRAPSGTNYFRTSDAGNNVVGDLTINGNGYATTFNAVSASSANAIDAENSSNGYALSGNASGTGIGLYIANDGATADGATINTKRGHGLSMSKTGSVTGDVTDNYLSISNTLNLNTNTCSMNYLRIVDNTSNGTNTSKILSVVVDGTERITMKPRFAAGTGGNVYLFDTHENLQQDDTIFNVKNNGTTVFSVDSSVTRTTNPYLYVSFADSSSAIDITQNVYSKITNPGNDLLTSNINRGGFTFQGDTAQIPITGIYEILIKYDFEGPASAVRINGKIFANGAPLSNQGAMSRTTSTSAQVGSVTFINSYNFTAGDWVSFRVTNVTGSQDINSINMDVIIKWVP